MQSALISHSNGTETSPIIGPGAVRAMPPGAGCATATAVATAKVSIEKATISVNFIMKFTDIVAFSILTFAVATAVAVAQPAPGGIARTAPGPMMGDVSVPFEWLIRAPVSYTH